MLRTRVAIVATLPALVASACAAQQRVGRPPSAAEIRQINAATTAYGGGLELEYVQESVRPPNDPVKIERIVSANAQEMTVVTDEGERRSIGLPSIKAVTAPDGEESRARSILIGTTVGAGFAAVEIGGLYLLAQGLASSDTGAPHSSGSYGPVIGLAVTSVLVGAAIGALAQPSRAHRVFVLHDADHP